MPSSKRLIALLIGIDEYAYPEIKDLSGCKADIRKVKAFLEKATEANGWDFLPHELFDAHATRANVLAAWQTHLIEQAGPDDVAMIYFSGHGAQEAAGELFAQSEGDGKLEGWVCHDMGPKPGQGLLIADKEIRFLLRKLSQTGAEVIYVSDSCHAGDNHRSAQSPAVERPARRTGIVMPARASYSDFCFAEEIPEEAIRTQGLSAAMPQGRFVAIAACDSWEYAWEEPRGGGGYFTHYFLKTLEEQRGKISYYDLVSRVKLLLARELKREGITQVPRVAASPEYSEDVFREFLSGAVRERPLGGNLVYDRGQRAWVFDRGTIHGVQKTKEGELGSLLVVSLEEDTFAYGYIQSVEPSKSTVVFKSTEAGSSLIKTDQTYTGLLGDLLSSPLYVYVTGAAAGVKAVTELGQERAADFKRKNIYLTEKADDAQVWIQAINREGTEYLILTLPEDSRPLSLQTIGWDEKAAAEVLGHLKSLVPYFFTLQLQHPKSLLGAHPVELSPHQDKAPVPVKEGQALLAYQTERKGKPYGKASFQLANTTKRDLYVACLYMGNDYSIFPGFMQPAVDLIKAGQSAWIREGAEVTLTYDAHIENFNWPEDKLYLKVISSTEPFTVDLFGQEGLPRPVFPWPKPGDFRSTSKGLVFVNDEDEEEELMNNPEWQADLFTIRIPNPRFRPEE